MPIIFFVIVIVDYDFNVSILMIMIMTVIVVSTDKRKLLQDTPPHLILPHGSYLMNLGSPNPETLDKSRNMLLEELQRCERLGIPHYNFHPGL